MEYNAMLEAICEKDNFTYGEGLGKERQAFEESIYYSLHKISSDRNTNLASTVRKWQESFSSFFSQQLYKTIKL